MEGKKKKEGRRALFNTKNSCIHSSAHKPPLLGKKENKNKHTFLHIVSVYEQDTEEHLKNTVP